MKTTKPTTVGYVLGRFNPLQHGHAALLKHAAAENEHLIVHIGSATEGRTLKNPLTFDERKALVKAVVPQAIVAPVPDMPSDVEWRNMMESTLTAGLESLHLEGEFCIRLYSADATRGDDHALRCSWVSGLDIEVVPFKPVTTRADLSASLVRDNWYHGRLDEVKELVPAETFELLANLDLGWAKSSYVKEIPKGERGLKNSVHIAFLGAATSTEDAAAVLAVTTTGEFTWVTREIAEDSAVSLENAAEFVTMDVCRGAVGYTLELVCSHASMDLQQKEVVHQHLFVCKLRASEFDMMLTLMSARKDIAENMSTLTRLPLSTRTIDVMLSQKWSGAGLEQLKTLIYQGDIKR